MRPVDALRRKYISRHFFVNESFNPVTPSCGNSESIHNGIHKVGSRSAWESEPHLIISSGPVTLEAHRVVRIDGRLSSILEERTRSWVKGNRRGLLQQFRSRM
ncbi:hypothetical protein DTO164E3_3473 [Paecilomyces variotii]|nr:hypothetical protein DTO164E3_3473 [Paecilomyces variotii]KAJ9268105.1 hypothetical protein DTO212C5_5793 [Paecilomyces variotii]KAJ9279800.1 hypothetical protein DTO021D3_3305 [Paecilomyces variotii]